MADQETADTSAEKDAVDVAREAADNALEQGFIGEKVDPEPNEVYTIAGVTGQLKSTKKR